SAGARESASRQPAPAKPSSTRVSTLRGTRRKHAAGPRSRYAERLRRCVCHSQETDVNDMPRRHPIEARSEGLILSTQQLMHFRQLFQKFMYLIVARTPFTTTKHLSAFSGASRTVSRRRWSSRDSTCSACDPLHPRRRIRQTH